MTARGGILVTTTQQLEGWRIEEYLGPISSHVVAGTGFFVDIAAGFSDIFGGRSASYQKQLTQINTEVLKLLKDKARERGANCILGVRIDHDEISGKAKQMFMVTAFGTAAFATRIGKSDSERKVGNLTSTTSADVRAELKKRLMLRELRSQDTAIEVKWDYFVENRVAEAAPDIVSFIIRQSKDSPYSWDNNWKKCSEYLRVLPNEVVKKQLYDMLKTPRKDSALQAIDELSLLDYQQVQNLLGSSDPALRCEALRVLKTQKEFYDENDITELTKLQLETEKVFPRKTMQAIKGGILKSKERSGWICSCGQENLENENPCSKCRRDWFGVPQGYPNPPELKALLEERIDAIKTILAGSEQ